MESIVYWVWLHNALNYRGNNVKALLGYFKDARSIYCADDEEIDKCSDITPSEKERLCSRSLSDAQKIVRRCKGINCRILPICDEKYPDKLRKIDDPPAVIFVKGDISHIDEPCAAIVGTRNPSLSGKTMAYNCAAELSKNGIHIISGCADGIDTQAHKGALQTGFDTYAVLGGGVNHKYLKKNQLLRTEISKHGALISEYPPDIEPTEYTFPLRNRIISGISLGIFVAEAPLHSGALITAESAIEQERDVFCLPPHDIFDRNFEGVVKYLRDGAFPVFSHLDIIYEYCTNFSHKLSPVKPSDEYSTPRGTDTHVSEPAPKKNGNTHVKKEVRPRADLSGLPENQRIIADLLEERDHHIDELCERSGIDMPDLLTELTEMEVSGLAVSLPGNIYALK